MTSLGKSARIAWGVTSILLVESVIVGLSVVPGLVCWRYILNAPFPLHGKYLETALLGFAFVPSYLVFCVALMGLTAVTCRVLGWRSTPGSHSLRELEWPLVRWAQYNAATHVVRVFAGGIFRASFLWTWFIRANGATVGRGVHINTLGIYDHNLLTFGDGVVVGSDAKLSAHVTERGSLLVAPVVLGKKVVIGTNSIVYPGVTVGDDAQVGAMSLVPKHTKLEAGGVYAGVPARPLHEAEHEPHRAEPL